MHQSLNVPTFTHPFLCNFYIKTVHAYNYLDAVTIQYGIYIQEKIQSYSLLGRIITTL